MAVLLKPPFRELFRTVPPLLPRNFSPSQPNARSFHQTTVVQRVQAGRYRKTPYRTRGLTYEQFYDPSYIGLAKSWNSWNTSNLLHVNTNDQAAKITVYDMFIRKFIYGTWHNLFASEVIIKRRQNAIYIAGVVQQTIPARKMYFLIGYTEEFLGFFLKAPVKMELSSIPNKKDLIYTYI